MKYSREFEFSNHHYRSLQDSWHQGGEFWLKQPGQLGKWAETCPILKKNEEGDTEGENEEAEDEEESQKCSENFEEHDHVDTESGERKGGKGEEGRQIPGEFPDEEE